MLKQLFTLFFAALSCGVFAQDLENLGKGVNTVDDTECYPCISPDGRTLYFSRQGTGTQDYDIMYSELDSKGNWGPAKFIDELNNDKKNVVYNISPDGNTIILIGTYDPPSSKGLSYSTKTRTGWSKPQRMAFERYDDIDWGNNAVTFTADRKRLIISLDGDLHTSKWLASKKMWSFPQKMEGVNTTSNEYTPFLAQDGKTVYFSSGGWPGEGGNDIFKSTRLDDTWLNWTEPENLGKPVNSSGWESFFAVSAKGDYAFVYSLKEGDGDLFRIKLKEELRPDPVVLVKGKVVNAKTSESLPAVITYENLAEGVVVGEALTNAKTGEYQIILTRGCQYGFMAEAEGFISVSENLDLTEIKEYTEIERDLKLVPIEKGQKVVLNNIFFDVAKASLRPESFPELDRVANMLVNNANMKIEIGGHTDSDGSDAFNLKLSGDRAASVRNYILSKGVPADKITSKGYGEAQPVASNDTDAGKQQNRRVEFTILDH